MKKVAVIGANGNMGRRYAMILEQYCGCEVVRVDIDTHSKIDDLVSCDGIIIATPTDNHVEDILHYGMYQKPILCEKPISKDLPRLKRLLNHPNLDLSMINQYYFLQLRQFGFRDSDGDSYYHYFKSGADSLAWDCINIIGMADGPIEVSNDSLIWKCKLNGYDANLCDMDEAYIRNIQLWVKGWRNKDYIYKAHKKVLEYINDKKS